MDEFDKRPAEEVASHASWSWCTQMQGVPKRCLANLSPSSKVSPGTLQKEFAPVSFTAFGPRSCCALLRTANMPNSRYHQHPGRLCLNCLGTVSAAEYPNRLSINRAAKAR